MEEYYEPPNYFCRLINTNTGRLLKALRTTLEMSIILNLRDKSVHLFVAYQS